MQDNAQPTGPEAKTWEVYLVFAQGATVTVDLGESDHKMLCDAFTLSASDISVRNADGGLFYIKTKEVVGSFSRLNEE